MTLESIKLLKQERDALNVLCGALANLSNVRNAQVLDEKKSVEAYAADARGSDTMLDQLHDKLDKIMTRFGIPYVAGKTAADVIELRMETLVATIAKLEGTEMPF